MPRITLAVLILLISVPIAAAHQPRYVKTNFVQVSNPEVSQAFYAALQGEPHIYEIRSVAPFRLYVGLLVPQIPKVRTDLSAEISRLDSEPERLALLNGTGFQWTRFWEPFAGDSYLQGPEFAAPESRSGTDLKGREMPAGVYSIRIINPGNRGKYALAIGDLERWSFREMLNTLVIMPEIKRKIFEKPLWSATINRVTLFFGFLALIAMAIVALAARLIVRLITRKARIPA